MPKAVVDISLTERYELESCPEGYVVLRRMTYGEKLQRQDMALDMAISGDNRQNTEMKLTGTQTKVTHFEFSRLITEHNLEDAEGRQLDFKKLDTVQRLDPRIGQEIADLIESMNELDEGN